MSFCPKYIAPSVEPVQTAKQVQQRALTGAGFSHQRELLALGDFEIEACENDQIGTPER